MSTIKISQLPILGAISTNTSNNLFLMVDTANVRDVQITGTTLAQGLYANNILNVGTNQQNLPNTIAQFALGGQDYIQTNLVNTNDGGSADVVVTANVNSGGSDSTNFIDMGYANKLYQPGSEFNNIGTAISPLDGYLYVQGTTGSLGGNLIIGTTTSNTELRFIAGGGTASNVVAKMTSVGLVMNTQSSITFGDGTKQLTASNPANYSTAAFAQANSAAANTIFSTGARTTQNNNIQFAWNLANTSLQNTSTITTNSNFIVSGNLTTSSNIVSQNGYIQFNNSTFNSTLPFIQITASNNYATVAPSNTNYMLQVTGKANSVTRVVIDSFGQNTYPVVIGRMGRGSADVPAATQNTDVLMRIVGNGYTGTQFPSSSPTKIDFVAVENFSDTNRGTQIQFWNTKVGSNTLNQIAVFNGETVTFTGNLNPAKGFIYAPLVYPAAQTAITIDFANNSMVRAQTSSGLVVSMTNYTVGKMVELWITNTAGTNQTYTTGVSAINSTLNATTYTIPGTSTVCARYFCVDGTLANTLVSVIHA